MVTEESRGDTAVVAAVLAAAAEAALLLVLLLLLLVVGLDVAVEGSKLIHFPLTWNG